MRHSLIADTRTDREFDLRNCLFATLYKQREICFLMVPIENQLLPYLGAATVFKDKREFSLLVFTEVYFNVAACLIDAFDFVRRRSKSCIQVVITSLQLKRCHAWLALQSFRRDQLEWFLLRSTSAD